MYNSVLSGAAPLAYHNVQEVYVLKRPHADDVRIGIMYYVASDESSVGTHAFNVSSLARPEPRVCFLETNLAILHPPPPPLSYRDVCSHSFVSLEWYLWNVD